MYERIVFLKKRTRMGSDTQYIFRVVNLATTKLMALSKATISVRLRNNKPLAVGIYLLTFNVTILWVISGDSVSLLADYI